jgi:uncharacterized protein YeeX (DUF496 family)
MRIRTDLSLEELRNVVEYMASELGILDDYVPEWSLMKGEQRRPSKKVKFSSKALEELTQKTMKDIKEVVDRWRTRLQKVLTE